MLDKQNVLYLLKCVAGAAICYGLYAALPQYPLYWAIVSVVLALSPDNSNRQAYDRIKANLLGASIGICLFPLRLPELLLLCLGIGLTICAGVLLKVDNGLRSALAALVIVTLNEEQTRHWYIALERVSCVVVGCLVALLLTILFGLVFPVKKE